MAFALTLREPQHDTTHFYVSKPEFNELFEFFGLLFFDSVNSLIM